MLETSKNWFAFAALSLLLNSQSALSSPINFVPNGDNNAGTVKCEVPLNSLGKLALKSGCANISGKVISIKSATEFSEAPRTVLVGSVLRSEVNLSSEPPSVGGLALLLMGDWVDQVDDGKTLDLIFRKEGQIAGRILGLQDESITVALTDGKQLRVPISSVLYIRSPRVFVFKIALKSKQSISKDTEFVAETTDASFRPTSTARTLTGSVIPQSQRNDDGLAGLNGPMGSLGGAGLKGNPTMNSLGALNAPGALPGLGGLNTMGSMGAMNGFGAAQMNSAVPNPRDNSFDQGEDSKKFSTVEGKWGKQKLSLPPGMLD